MYRIEEIIAHAAEQRASDVHVVSGLPIRFRVDGKLTDFCEERLSQDQCDRYAHDIAGIDYENVLQIGELDLAATYAGIRCRINLFRQQGNFSAAIRLLNNEIPKLEALELPPVIQTFVNYPRGIVIITGATGSGKSTTLAALLDRINHTRGGHIITLEDPIEYIYVPDRSVINQREIGKDTQSFAQGLRAALREDPDIILVGEMRDLATIETALTAAETGHLVFATLHTNFAADSIDRMVDVFPEGRQHQIRLQLSMTLKAVVSQQLLLKQEGHGRVAACEVMMVNPAIRNLIREGKTPQINNTLATSAAEGSITMDNQLISLVRARKISPETAIAASNDVEYVRKTIKY